MMKHSSVNNPMVSDDEQKEKLLTLSDASAAEGFLKT